MIVQENMIHDRSLWIPMDIETATGNADIVQLNTL